MGETVSHIEKFKALGERVARSPKTRRWGLRALIAFVALGVLGFLVAPPIVKHVLQQQASAALLRPVTVDSVGVNPYTLAVTLRGLKVHEKEGGALLAGVETLYVNADLSSLFRAAPVVSALRVEKPVLRLVRLEANRYNISDILEAFAAKPSGPTPRFALFNIEVSGGEVSLDDRVVDEKHVLGDIVLRLPFVSSLPSFAQTDVEPYFSATVDGAPLVLKGSTRPFHESLETEFAVDLDRFDLARFNDYLPAQLPLQLAAGTLDGDLRLTFRQHAAKPAEMALAGRLLLRGLDLREKAGKPFATVQSLEVGIDEADLLHRKLAISKVALADLAVQAAEGGKPGIQLAALTVQGVTAELDKQVAGAKQVEVRGIQTQLSRLADGRIAWLASLPLPAKSGEAAPAKAGAPWQVSLGSLRVSEVQAQFEDRQTRPVAVQTVLLDTLAVDNLSTQPGQPAKLELAMRINKKGELKTQGSVQMAPLQAELALEAAGIELLPLQPYFNDKVSLIVTRGQVAAKGTVSVQTGKEGGIQGSYSGDLTLGDFASVDKANAVDFLRWKSLYFGAIQVQSAPLNIKLGEVALSDFYSRLVISPQGKLNVLQLLRPVGAPEPVAAAAPAAQAAVPGEELAGAPPAAPSPAMAVQTAAPAAPPLPIQIGKVTLQGGTVNFTDNFIKPNYSARLTRIGGRVSGLSSDPQSTADLELRGSYDNLAPITIGGKINPLAAKPTLDIKAEVKGMDMMPFSPYAAKYAGYGIEKGKLSLFVSYKIENQQLTAENRLFLDQLTFGEESAEGSKLPVKLAVALLQNRKGEIDINLPISGSLDDPQFSIGGIVVKVILNLFVKAVTSPFALIGSLFGGGGEELSSMAFDPGRASINAAGKSKLENIAKVLNERPAIKLEVAGNVDPEVDREGYKSAVLDRKVRRLKLNERVEKGVESDLADIQIDPKEYPALLEKVYRAESFPKPRNLVGMVKTLPVEEMEKLILANTQVSDDDLRQLANRRAQRVRDFLVNQANVPGDRVFLVPPKVEKTEGKDTSKGGRVDFSLK